MTLMRSLFFNIYKINHEAAMYKHVCWVQRVWPHGFNNSWFLKCHRFECCSNISWKRKTKRTMWTCVGVAERRDYDCSVPGWRVVWFPQDNMVGNTRKGWACVTSISEIDVGISKQRWGSDDEGVRDLIMYLDAVSERLIS